MNKSYLKNIVKTKEYSEILSALNKRNGLLLHGLEEEAMLLIASVLSKNEKRQVLILVSDDMKASRIYGSIKNIYSNSYHLRAKEYSLYGIDALSRESINSRLAVIDKLSGNEDMVIVSSVEAYSNLLMEKERYDKFAFNIEYGLQIDLKAMSSNLVEMGYKKVKFIEGKGQFSIRGGILDIFSPAESNPCRIELFDIEIDSLRIFDSKTQRSIENIDNYRIIPCCEIVLSDEEIKVAVRRFTDDIEQRLEFIRGKEDTRTIEENLLKLKFDVVEALENRNYIDNIEFYRPYLPVEQKNLGDYLREDAIVIFDEPNLIREARKGSREDFISKFSDLYSRGMLLSKQEKIFIEFETLVGKIKSDLSFIVYNNNLKNNVNFKIDKVFNIRSRELPLYYSKMDDLAKDINRYKYRGYKVYLELGKEESARNIQEMLSENDCEISILISGNEEILSGQGAAVVGAMHKGMEFPQWKIAILTEKEILGTKKRKKKLKKKHKASKIDSFTDLKPGDYVVHEYHGLGIYTGIEKIDVKDIQKDYLCISYRDKDKLFVPVDQMDLVQKYIGSDSAKPKINKMGGTEWVKAKSKAQKAIDEIADELLKLYTERKSKKGYSFSHDNEWQRGFENSFPYQETEDQLRCIDEIKTDMTGEIAMDRLLCGDVGFGKTEVAMRAIFKAVMDSKQAAVLVPTTILAQQHYTNMVERFKNYPVKVEMLSRFRTPGQQRKIISDLNKGLIDVVVGTHKLLSKDVRYKDLGLLVIDEEQRFGVKHKEIIKQMKTNIDVLTLTATPIPRTLNMSMVGIRDMSVIEEPPGERHPVQTFVLESSSGLIKEALIKELSRGGQVYYVHNRVKDIHNKAAMVKNMVPDARIAVAHGQMSERELENIMVEFIEGEYDILVCTTIIETGMDISNVNTIIIDDSDKMGLSQLYQLRGRVGRSDRTAFAYLTYERNKVLSEIADKRLKAVKEFTEFGSGFKIAMRDLEIRGAGNILGSQQSGHLEAIGYDLYVKMMERTLNRITNNEEREDDFETVIEIDVNGHIPVRYIEDEEQKIEIYKKISVIENHDDISDVTEEIIDRFGDIPKSVNNLIKISYIKSICKKLKIVMLRQINNVVHIEFKNGEAISPAMINGIMEKYKGKFKFDVSNKPVLKYSMGRDEAKDVLVILENTVENLYNFSTDKNSTEKNGGSK